MRSICIHNAIIFGKPDHTAMLCENGIITAFLNEREVEKTPSDLRLNAKGNWLLPSFFDAHIHLSEYGLRLERLNLNGKSLHEVLDLIRKKVKETPKGEWILGGGWQKANFGEFPTRKLLDNISTEHFIALSSRDFHATWANTPALNLLNVKDFLPEELPKDEHGQCHGVVFERAALKLATLATVSTQALAKAIHAAQSKLFECGITDVFSIEGANALLALASLGKDLKLRVHVAIYIESLPEAKTFFKEHTLPNLSLNAVKLFLDGSLGAETCAMLEPFENSNNFGLSLYADADLVRLFKIIEREGLNIAVHAIGDRAVRRALDTFEKIGASPNSPFRHRIEHAQMIHDDDLHRFAKLGITASMQPIHIREDIALARRLLGKRQSELYRFKSLLNSGASVIFGSDAPIETPNVLEGCYYAIERRDKEGQLWHGNERLSFEETLRAYTEQPNLLINKSNRGRLEIGYEANAVIVPKDFLTKLRQGIPIPTVMATMLSGEIVFKETESGELKLH